MLELFNDSMFVLGFKYGGIIICIINIIIDLVISVYEKLQKKKNFKKIEDELKNKNIDI